MYWIGKEGYLRSRDRGYSLKKVEIKLISNDKKVKEEPSRDVKIRSR